MLVELGAGFEADISDSMTFWGQVKGAYGIGENDVVGYQGRTGIARLLVAGVIHRTHP